LQLLLQLLLLLCLLQLLCVCRRDRVGAEWQQAAQLAGHVADLLAHAGIAEYAAADGCTERGAHLSQDVAEPALRGELLSQLGLLLLLLLGLLLGLLLLKLLQQLLLLCLLSVCLRHRIGAKWQQRTANAACDLPDLAAQAGVTQQAANAAADCAAQRCSKYAT